MSSVEKINKVNNTSEKKGGLIKFFKEFKAEFKRITWASRQEVKKATITVLTFCLIYIVAITVLDFVFKNLSQFILK